MSLGKECFRQTKETDESQERGDPPGVTVDPRAQVPCFLRPALSCDVVHALLIQCGEWSHAVRQVERKGCK